MRASRRWWRIGRVRSRLGRCSRGVRWLRWVRCRWLSRRESRRARWLEASTRPANLVRQAVLRRRTTAMSHGALWTHLQDFLATYGIDGDDTVLHSSTISFDVALHETLPALLRGATVEMCGVQPWDLQSLSERLVNRRVTFARIPTALWQQ